MTRACWVKRTQCHKERVTTVFLNSFRGCRNRQNQKRSGAQGRIVSLVPTEPEHTEEMLLKHMYIAAPQRLLRMAAHNLSVCISAARRVFFFGLPRPRPFGGFLISFRDSVTCNEGTVCIC